MVGGARSGTGSKPFTPISRPILKSVDQQQVPVFLKEREMHQLDVAEKNKEVPTFVSCVLLSVHGQIPIEKCILYGEIL